MYNHFNQYRCIIIRGKSQKEIDDLLSAYAKVIDDITPCETEVFSRKFNELLAPCLSADKRIKKTLDNHRTEIAGKLFGMYYVEENGYVYASDRTKKFLRIMTSRRSLRIYAIRCSSLMECRNHRRSNPYWTIKYPSDPMPLC